MFCWIFAKDYTNWQRLFINLFDILPKKKSCQVKYPAGYPVSGFWISQISGKKVSGASHKLNPALATDTYS
jgi:hypothetical protein